MGRGGGHLIQSISLFRQSAAVNFLTGEFLCESSILPFSPCSRVRGPARGTISRVGRVRKGRGTRTCAGARKHIRRCDSRMAKHGVCEFRPFFYPLPGMRCIGICDDAIDVFFLRLIHTTQLYQSVPSVPIGLLLPFSPVEIDIAGKLSRIVALRVNQMGGAEGSQSLRPFLLFEVSF